MNISLIGMPGVGKSTVGKCLAEALNSEFIDIDDLIEKEYGLKLYEIIEKEGEPAFLKIEESFVLSLKADEDYVISTGGSVVYSKKAMDFLQRISVLVFLDDSLENILKRLKNKETRGIIGNQDLAVLFKERYPLYLAYADLTIKIPENFNPDEVVDKIRKRLIF